MNEHRKGFFSSKRYRKLILKVITIVTGILIILFFGKTILSIMIAIILLAVGILSKLYKRFIGMSIGIEFVTLISILFCFHYGFFFGFCAAVFMTIVAGLINGRLGMAIVPQIISYFLISVISLLLQGVPFSLSAKILVIIYNISTFTMMVFLGARPEKGIFNIALNIAVNLLCINYVGEFLLGLL